MIDMIYLKRLSFHLGKLFWRVFSILAGVFSASLLNALRQPFTHLEDETPTESKSSYGEYKDGTPWPENIAHSDWEALYGKDMKRI